MVEQHLGKNARAEVIDIFTVPDYTALFEHCIDPHFSRAFKNTKDGQYSQLQWKFHAVKRDINHPLGVSTRYRAYAEDDVFEIISVDASTTSHLYTTGLRVQRAPVIEQPEDPTEFVNVLFRYPQSPIKPAGFKLGSSDGFKATLRGIGNYFGEKSAIYSEWRGFTNQFIPLHDSVAHYLRDIDWNSEIPMKSKLFGADYPIDKDSDITPTISALRAGGKDSVSSKIDRHYFDGIKIVVAKTTASVRHSGNIHKPALNPREILEDEAIARTPAEAATIMLTAIKNLPITVHKDVILKYLQAAGVKHAPSASKNLLLKKLVYTFCLLYNYNIKI